MAGIYERQQTAFAGAFASDQAALAITGPAGIRAALGIVQQAQVQFAQRVARIYDVSNGGNYGGAQGAIVPVFYVGGRTEGNFNLQRVLGPQSGAVCEFYRLLGNICSPQDLAFEFAGGCSSSNTSPAVLNDRVGIVARQSVKYSLEDCLMTNVQAAVTANDMIVNETVTGMFANMVCSGRAA